MDRRDRGLHGDRLGIWSRTWLVVVYDGLVQSSQAVPEVRTEYKRNSRASLFPRRCASRVIPFRRRTRHLDFWTHDVGKCPVPDIVGRRKGTSVKGGTTTRHRTAALSANNNATEPVRGEAIRGPTAGPRTFISGGPFGGPCDSRSVPSEGSPAAPCPPDAASARTARRWSSSSPASARSTASTARCRTRRCTRTSSSRTRSG